MNNLKLLRETLGLTQKELAGQIGVSRSTLCRFERGTYKTPTIFSKRSYDCFHNIEKFLAAHKAEKHSHKNINFSVFFSIGKFYRIHNLKHIGDDDIFIFEFIGKQGKHYCFKEVHGGWSRTYTDAQLIGKSIKEVTHES